MNLRVQDIARPSIESTGHRHCNARISRIEAAGSSLRLISATLARFCSPANSGPEPDTRTTASEYLCAYNIYTRLADDADLGLDLGGPRQLCIRVGIAFKQCVWIP